jgi:Fur family ferric uptake transcriptional regulator
VPGLAREESHENGSLPQHGHYREALHAQGLRVTAGRLAVLEYVTEHPHSSAADIHRGVIGELPSLTQQSVHNIVVDLTRCGILDKIGPPASNAALYEISADDHQHFQCVVCRGVADVALPTRSIPGLHLSTVDGHRVLGVEVTFFGVCKDCESGPEESHSPRVSGDRP